jgi:hypothetical protein
LKIRPEVTVCRTGIASHSLQLLGGDLSSGTAI